MEMETHPAFCFKFKWRNPVVHIKPENKVQNLSIGNG